MSKLSHGDSEFSTFLEVKACVDNGEDCPECGSKVCAESEKNFGPIACKNPGTCFIPSSEGIAK